jgi:upstream activation factor subunit UAF30
MATKITRKPEAASVKPVTADAAASTVGKKKVWDYIKKNSLQDKAKRPLINADAKL